jgi:hypothetical protein
MLVSNKALQLARQPQPAPSSVPNLNSSLSILTEIGAAHVLGAIYEILMRATVRYIF